MSDATIDALPAAEQGMVAETELKAGALGLPSVLMQGVTAIAPAIAILYSFQFIVGLAGTAAPWVYVAAMVIVFMTAVSLVSLARAFPSAGSYFTFVSRTVHPRAGFMSGWMYWAGAAKRMISSGTTGNGTPTSNSGIPMRPGSRAISRASAAHTMTQPPAIA